MSNEFMKIEFTADAILSHMRGGNQPTEEDADFLNRLPIIDALRARVTEADLPWIFDVLERESGEVAGLYLSLLRKYTERQDIQLRLREKWKDANAFLRAHLMWRILDDPNLPPEWHRKIFDFILETEENWEEFKKVSAKFLGTPQTIVTNALKRLADPTFPDSKKWAYLCRVPEVAEDQAAAKALVSLGRSMRDPFTQEVAEILLKRFFL